MQSCSHVQRLIADNRALLDGVRSAALEVKTLIEAISPLTESLTASVCPDCASVCCIDRHSRYDRSDMIFMSALGCAVPGDGTGTAETAPCRFLGRTGCILERTLRPYRCTWYFCTPLLDHAMERNGPSGYRRLLRMLQQITEKRTKMLHEFEKSITPDKLPPEHGE